MFMGATGICGWFGAHLGLINNSAGIYVDYVKRSKENKEKNDKEVCGFPSIFSLVSRHG